LIGGKKRKNGPFGGSQKGKRRAHKKSMGIFT